MSEYDFTGEAVVEVEHGEGIIRPVYVGVYRKAWSRTDGISLNEAEARDLTAKLIAAGFAS